MKEWLTAAEIAAEKLAGVPETESGVIRLADREQWNESLAYARKRPGRGGGMEYHVALLPALARLQYETRYRAIARLDEAGPNGLDVETGLSERAALNKDARKAIVAAFDRFHAGQRWGLTSCLQFFVDKYNGRTLAIEEWIIALIPRLSKRTLLRWRAVPESRLAVDRSAARKGTGILDTAEGGKVRTFILALIAQQPLLSAKNIRKICRDEFGDRIADRHGVIIEFPTERCIQIFVKALRTSEKVLLIKLTDPDGYRSKMAPSGTGMLRHVTEPNALWMIDASPVDALCTDGRHSIYACIDVATRRTILYRSRTPRASAVALLMRKAILAWGVPAKVKTDNGSDFVARDTRRLLETGLGIEIERSDKYSPQQKAHVERVIGTFQHEVGPLLQGFIGHNVSDRKKIEDRRSFAARLGVDTADLFCVSMTGEQLQRHIDDWIETVYQHAAHAGLKGKTPFQAGLESSAPIRAVDERALDILLMAAPDGDGYRTVTKRGVRIDGFHYIVNACLPGDRVFVRMDPADAGRIIVFAAADGRYLGEGICPEKRGIDPSKVVQAKREAQAEILEAKGREARAEIRKLTKGRPLIERVLETARRDMPNVVALPKREVAHTTPAIEAALDASRPRSEPAPLTGRAAEIHAAMQAEAPEPAPSSVVPIRTVETPHQRFRRAREIEERIAAAGEVSAQEAVWLGGYQQGPEYRALRAFHEDAEQANQ